MKRKRKSWVEVTCFHERLMYVPKLRKWQSYDEIKFCSSSHATFNTLARARKNAVALSKKISSDVHLLHWFYKKGKRVCEEWIIKGGKEV